MNLNKCERCGCFFTSKNQVCPNCQEKDENDIKQLKKFLNDSDVDVSVESLSAQTGVSIKNVNRFLKDKNLYNTFTSLGLNSENNNNNNISISL